MSLNVEQRHVAWQTGEVVGRFADNGTFIPVGYNRFRSPPRLDDTECYMLRCSVWLKRDCSSVLRRLGRRPAASMGSIKGENSWYHLVDTKSLWNSAVLAATQAHIFDLQGSLVTIETAAEGAFLQSMLQAAGVSQAWTAASFMYESDDPIWEWTIPAHEPFVSSPDDRVLGSMDCEFLDCHDITLQPGVYHNFSQENNGIVDLRLSAHDHAMALSSNGTWNVIGSIVASRRPYILEFPLRKRSLGGNGFGIPISSLRHNL